MTGNEDRSLVLSDDSAVTAPRGMLGCILDRLGPHLADVVEDFYAGLGLRPEFAEVVGRLTPEEFAHLRRRQVEHLRFMLSEVGGPERLAARSREVGRVHAMVGVEMDWYVDAMTEHRDGLLRALARYAGDLDLVAANVALSERMMKDLHGALLGFRDLDAVQNDVMLRVLEAASSARTVADLARSVVEALAGMDGMRVCFFMRADAQGHVVNEIGAGPAFGAFVEDARHGRTPLVMTSGAMPEGRGAIGRAWRSGQVERVHSYQTDPTVVPWREAAERYGWRANASVPLTDPRGVTRALLSLHARWPGFFASESRLAMLGQVKSVVERALTDLEERPTLASGVSAYGDRSTHLQLLAEGRVEMLFQPVVSLPRGELCKLEALARLRGESRLLSPAEFLPAFGDDDLYTLFDIGLRQSLGALATWQRAGVHTGVSVNLPVAAADDPRYLRQVAALLGRYGVEPGRLTLELLETGAVRQAAKRQGRPFDDFKDLGVRLAQDDLGSGYSSLLRLRHFAFDDVKIDQSLVRGTELAPGAALHFIKPINDIAHSLGLTVVIEGLETDGLIEAAVQLGVDMGQGYGIARPMPADEVVAWAAGYRLDVDPETPQTPLGAIAAHVAWEHRMVAIGDTGTVAAADSGLGCCGLTSYAERLGSPAVTAAHRAAHVAALAQRGSVQQRLAWQRLSDLVLGV